jgi:ketosteroid isomerase-like protein
MNVLHQLHLIKRDVMVDDRTEVLEFEQRYSATINASDVDEIDDLFADDAILMLPDRPAVTGRNAIVVHQQEFSGRSRRALSR